MTTNRDKIKWASLALNALLLMAALAYLGHSRFEAWKRDLVVRAIEAGIEQGARGTHRSGIAMPGPFDEHRGEVSRALASMEPQVSAPVLSVVTVTATSTSTSTATATATTGKAPTVTVSNMPPMPLGLTNRTK